MLTIQDILNNKISLDLECIDRVYLNGYVKDLQMAGGLITFIREQMNCPVPSPIVMPRITNAFRKAVTEYAASHGLEIFEFAKGQEKDEVARAHLAKFQGKSDLGMYALAQGR